LAVLERFSRIVIEGLPKWVEFAEESVIQRNDENWARSQATRRAGGLMVLLAWSSFLDARPAAGLTWTWDGGGTTTLVDLALQRANFGTALPSRAASAATVPDPVAWIMVMAATETILLVVGRRRR
jgi:hypothetical protein